MRSIWNGAISFGLVSIPIKLVNATESHSVSFRQIHTEDGGRIRYRKVCELEDREVTSSEIGKGYEDADGTIVPITDEDLAQLPIPTTRTIEIVAFVPADRIDPLQLGAAYYLGANGVPAAKPYTLLREALKRSNRVAIAKYALRGRERLGMLRVVDDVIAMHGLLWPDEIRAPEGVAPDANVTVRDKELDLADALMDTLGEVDLDDLHDDYREAVEELIAAKTSGEEPRETAAPARSGKVLDLMAALEGSVRAARESRAGGSGGAGDAGEAGDAGDAGETEEAEHAEVRDLRKKKTPAKKAAGAKKSAAAGAAKKAAAKKQAAKKTTAKKSTPRRRSA
ncbi:non-homologous end joining protein Ku [Streptomyces griseoaurantiacus]|uniref:Non-homologous end joining protein Ku n=1 Tax=Streptomyces griseoaurantiacus TaxID=68213 RepID=A0A1G7GBN0_9ACTN|nr:Ku protein [Streptomyces jietaisiensis]SDE85495.1 DNA end-binding protein Ku [Streptomyces jietaisiensis]